MVSLLSKTYSVGSGNEGLSRLSKGRASSNALTFEVGDARSK
jgi:hypothetical protein